jgi:hypothetical protein
MPVKLRENCEIKRASVNQPVETGVAQDDFKHTAGGRIAPEDGVELLTNVSGHA